MFCLHCGKKLEEDSAFCSGCGKAVGGGQPAAPSAPVVPTAPAQQVIYVNQVKEERIVGAPEEIKKKIAVVIMFSLGAAILLIFILSVLVTKLKIFAEFMDFSGISQRSFEEFLEYMYDENEMAICFSLLLLFLVKVIEALILRGAFVHRRFTNYHKTIIIESVGSSICWIILPPILANRMSEVSERLGNVSLSGFIFFIIALIVTYKIAYAIMYHNASVCENSYIYFEEMKNSRV